MADLKAIQRLRRVTAIGRLAFGALITPRVNDYGKSEWHVGFVLSEVESEPILAAIEEALAAKREENPKFPKENTALKFPFRQSMKKDENDNKVPVEGELLWSFVRRQERKNRNGETSNNTPPALYDASGALITGKVSQVGGGTMGKVVFELYVYDQPGNKGVSLQLVGFQIAELATGEEQALDPIEGGGFVLNAEGQGIEALLSGNG